MFRVKFLCVMLISVLSLGVQAQKKLEGVVRDRHGKAIPYANVLLCQSPDSTLLANTITDLQGNFVFDETPQQNTFLKISYIGYSPKFVQLTEDLKHITLSDKIHNLNEITIKGAKKAIIEDATGFTVKVKDYTSTQGKSALEVLEVIPGVLKNGTQISVMGKTATIYVNGRSLNLSGKAAENYIASLQADNVKSIRVITDPDAKYDANITGGIVDIELKYDKGEGINSGIILGAGIKKTGMVYSPSISFNYRKNKMNWYGSYGFYTGKFEKDIDQVQHYQENDKKYINENHEFKKTDGVSNNITLGLDYFASKKHTIGLLIQAGTYNGEDDSGIETYIYPEKEDKPKDVSIQSDLFKDNSNKNITSNLNHHWKIDSTGASLNTDITLSYIGNDNSHLMKSTHLNDVYSGNSQNIDNQNTILTARMDYVKSFRNQLRLETGWKANVLKRSIKQGYVEFEKVETTPQNIDTKYDENIVAGYAKLDKKWKTNSIAVGVRAEHTYYKGNTEEEFSDNYWDLFPSFSFRQSLTKKSSLSVSYLHKIVRPSLSKLNPYRFYNGYNIYQQGNPNLKPYYIHYINLRYSIPSVVTLSLSHSRYNDQIFLDPQRNPKTNEIVNTYQNLGNSNKTSLYLYIPLRIGSWWRSNFSAVANYDIYDNQYQGRDWNSDNLWASVQLYNQFKISKTFTSEWTFFYSTKRNWFETVIDPRANLNIRFIKSLWNKKGSISATLVDPFRWNSYASTLNSGDIHLDISESTDRTMLRLTFSYNLGSNQVKSKRRRSTGAESIEGRVK
ncbi:TonB-dependent receptor [Halosquirtibacter xylanolyticus]|uniref:outer membrane beta-barrel family protein n=1 Tax=Halosquirtibacter xylanolyticus TaxID=3374599 RepID=UPI003747ABB7|nr:TonB-dependent receptor [Prolixibacteraceae bacterium]